MAKQILRRKWGWIGHTLRKPASSTTRQALTWNPQGKRKRGRPRNSWRRGTGAELKQQGANWSGMTRAAQNRVRWRGVVDVLCSAGSHVHNQVSKSLSLLLLVGFFFYLIVIIIIITTTSTTTTVTTTTTTTTVIINCCYYSLSMIKPGEPVPTLTLQSKAPESSRKCTCG